jgi:hypothetical protein
MRTTSIYWNMKLPFLLVSLRPEYVSPCAVNYEAMDPGPSAFHILPPDLKSVVISSQLRICSFEVSLLDNLGFIILKESHQGVFFYKICHQGIVLVGLVLLLYIIPKCGKFML